MVDGKTVADKLKEDTLNKTLEFKIEYMKAKEAGTVADKQTLSSMYSEVENYVQSQGGGQAGNEKFKAETGVGSSQFKAFYREFMIINKYAEEYKKNAKFSDEELQKHYTKNEAKLKKVTVRHILLLTQDMNTGAPLSKDKQQKAKEKADSLLKRIKAGEDIKTLATEFSEDPGVKENFGEYTFAKTGQMVPEFEDWAFKAKVGDVAIVKSQFGYHVMKLEKFGSMADVKEDVRMSLASEKLEGLVDVWKKDKQFAMTKNTKVFDAIKLN